MWAPPLESWDSLWRCVTPAKLMEGSWGERQKLITDILIKGHHDATQNTTWRFVQRENRIKIVSKIYFPHKNAADPPIIYVTGRPCITGSYSGDGLNSAKQTSSLVMKKCCCLCFSVHFLITIHINVMCTPTQGLTHLASEKFMMIRSLRNFQR